jgi:hypothetical protein
MTSIRIEDLKHHVDQPVTVQGWVTTTRSSGKIAFLVLRDGTGLVQGVLARKDVPEETWARFVRPTHAVPGGSSFSCLRLRSWERVWTIPSLLKNMGRATSSSIDISGSGLPSRPL